MLTENGVQLVLAGHIHAYRCDPPAAGRPWAEITGGGRGASTYQTLVECKVANGRLLVRVHNTDSGEVVAEHWFRPRRPAAFQASGGVAAASARSNS